MRQASKGGGIKLSKPRRIALMALLVSLALSLGYLESLFPLPVPLPGVKLGLGNICVLLALYWLGARDALLVTLFKVGISVLLFASPMALLFSLVGGLLAFLGMLLTKNLFRLHIIAVSMTAAVLHNIAQIVAAAVLLQTAALLLYLPPLMLVGCVTGALTGVIAAAVIRALESVTSTGKY